MDFAGLRDLKPRKSGSRWRWIYKIQVLRLLRMVLHLRLILDSWMGVSQGIFGLIAL